MSKYKNIISSLVNKTRRKRQKSFHKPLPKDDKKLPIKIFNKGRIFLLFVSLGFVFICLYILPFVVNFFRLDFNKGYGDTKKTTEISYSSKINIIFIGVDEYSQEYRFIDGLALISYDYSSKELGIFSINPDLKVNIPGLNRQMELRRMLNYSLIKGSETDYIVSSLESLLAIKIDRYVYVTKEGFAKISDLLPSIGLKLNRDLQDQDTINLPKGRPLNLHSGQNTIGGVDILSVFASDANGKDDQLDRQTNIILASVKNIKNLKILINVNDLWQDLINNVKTNMTKLEMARMLYDLMYIRDDMVKKGFTRSSSYYQLPSTNIYGSYGSIQERLDKDISSIFFNLDIFKEHAKIEIFNASGVRGLAGNRYRWMINMGGNVVKVNNADEDVDEVYIYCEDPAKFEKTINEIKKIFSGSVVIKKERYYNRQIGDIVIVIGRNYR